MNIKIQKLLLLPLVISMLAVSPTFGGDDYSEEAIKKEISYLAKKLLDMSGKDSYTVSSPAYKKPFLGVCSEVRDEGIEITCITPGSGAENGGLRTGDTITSINGQSLVNSDLEKAKKAYWKRMHTMKTGEILEVDVIRANERMQLKLTVGTLDHPGYTLKINK